MTSEIQYFLIYFSDAKLKMDDECDHNAFMQFGFFTCSSNIDFKGHEFFSYKGDYCAPTM
jgi:hypothetical protein